tara:strand:+ start:1545 stop:2504 length:960 start_codon:yes stop_codon:yes gene_type:complete
MKKTNKILLELYNDRNQLIFLSVLAYVGSLIDSLVVRDPHIMEAGGAIIGALVVAGGTIYAANKSAKSARETREQAQAQSDQAIEFQREQQVKLDAQKAIYRRMEFTNPYEDIQNVYAGMENPYENMENTMEDLTVNQQQAQFMAQQGAQQRSNILESLKRTAGSSGVAGLAQSLANQGRLQAQQASASIAQQEQRNQALQAREASRLQSLEAQGAFAVDRMQRQAELQADMAFRGGEAMVQEAEMSRQATLLGMQYGTAAGANQAVQQSYSNQATANAYANQMQMQNVSNFMNLAGQIPFDELSLPGPTQAEMDSYGG